MFPGSACLFFCSKINRLIWRIYLSLTWMWKLGQNFQFYFGNNEAPLFHFWEYINRSQTFTLYIGFSPALYLQCGANWRLEMNRTMRLSADPQSPGWRWSWQEGSCSWRSDVWFTKNRVTVELMRDLRWTWPLGLSIRCCFPKNMVKTEFRDTRILHWKWFYFYLRLVVPYRGWLYK